LVIGRISLEILWDTERTAHDACPIFARGRRKLDAFESTSTRDDERSRAGTSNR